MNTKSSLTNKPYDYKSNMAQYELQNKHNTTKYSSHTNPSQSNKEIKSEFKFDDKIDNTFNYTADRQKKNKNSEA